jgi:site-specific DNA-methyltransferase (adenine-specific)
MRQIVRASLPLGRGLVLDPFMGAGSTIAAAIAVGYRSIGIERDLEYFRMAEKAIPALAQIEVRGISLPTGHTGGENAATKRTQANSYRKGS